MWISCERTKKPAYFQNFAQTTVSCMSPDPRFLEVNHFDYDLPPEKIALHPLPERDASKLLVYQNGAIADKNFIALPSLLPPHATLVFNQTKVVPARLLFQKATGGRIEIFCLAPANQQMDMNSAMMIQGSIALHCLVGGASKWKKGKVLSQERAGITLTVEWIGKTEDDFILQFNWTPNTYTFAAVLEAFGEIPLPPYLKRKPIKEDAARYQTIYAQQEGSVAAPTAGLHFTPGIFDGLKEKNIHTAAVTLHVGAGTFKPVKAAQMQGHHMHREWIDVSLAFLENWLHNIDQPLIAVGTTSLRTLESIYWLGVKLIVQPTTTLPALEQWECYELEKAGITLEASLEKLIAFLKEQHRTQLITETALLIAPGYQLKTIAGLITNFHQPKSTLLLLIAAVIGEDWKKVYAHALANPYRFLSYGDSSLLWKK